MLASSIRLKLFALSFLATILPSGVLHAAGNDLMLDPAAFSKFAKTSLQTELRLSSEPAGRIVLQDLVSAAGWAAGAFAQTHVAFLAEEHVFTHGGTKFFPAFVTFVQKDGSIDPQGGAVWLMSQPLPDRFWPVSMHELLITDTRADLEGNRFTELQETAEKLRTAFPNVVVEFWEPIGVLWVDRIAPHQFMDALKMASAESAIHPFLAVETSAITVHVPWILPEAIAIPADAPEFCVANHLTAVNETLQRFPDQCFANAIVLPDSFRGPGACARALPICRK